MSYRLIPAYRQAGSFPLLAEKAVRTGMPQDITCLHSYFYALPLKNSLQYKSATPVRTAGPGGQRKLNSYPSAWLQKNLVYHENPKNLRSINTTLSSYAIHDSRFTIDVHHSVFKLFTGLATAAFIACTLTVTKAITRAASPATKNIHHDICTR